MGGTHQESLTASAGGLEVHARHYCFLDLARRFFFARLSLGVLVVDGGSHQRAHDHHAGFTHSQRPQIVELTKADLSLML